MHRVHNLQNQRWTVNSNEVHMFPTLCPLLFCTHQWPLLAFFPDMNKLIKTKNSVAFSPQVNYTDRPSDRRMSAKLLPTFADRGCRVVSATDPYGR
jgi:hypothetical protein